MFKIMCFLTGKPGMDRESMRRHYEEVHVPLARKTFPQIIEHRRNWVEAEGHLFPSSQAAPPFDCISEIWFDSRADFEAMLETLADPEQAVEVKADEGEFLDPRYSGILLVEETK